MVRDADAAHWHGLVASRSYHGYKVTTLHTSTRRHHIYAESVRVSAVLCVSVNTAGNMEAPTKYKPEWNKLLEECKKPQDMSMGGIDCTSPEQLIIFLVKNLVEENFGIKILKSRDIENTCFEVSDAMGPFKWVCIQPHYDGSYCAYETEYRRKSFHHLADDLTQVKTRFCHDCGLPLMKS